MDAPEEALCRLLVAMAARDQQERFGVVFEGPDNRFIQFLGIDDDGGKAVAVLVEAVSNEFLPDGLRLGTDAEQTLMAKAPAFLPPSDDSPNYHLMMTLPTDTAPDGEGTFASSEGVLVPVGMSREHALRKLAALALELMTDVYGCSDAAALRVSAVEL